MSRIGKQPIPVTSGVTVTLTPSNIVVKGPKGELSCQIHRHVMVKQDGDIITVTVSDPEEKSQKSLWGLYRRLIGNMITGVTVGFSKKLEINGVGYRAAVTNNVLVLQLGYSHPINYQIPAGISITVDKNVVTVSGSDKQAVGQTAAEIRLLRKPEPYKGKGIKYSDEIIRRKAGKSAAKGAA